MRAHVIENNQVVNTIEVESLNFLPGLVEATNGQIGWSYVDGSFFPPVVPVDLVAEKAKKATEINTIRYLKIYMDSIPYTFPGDTEPDGIQMRDETDRQNIQDFYNDALSDVVMGNPEITRPFMPISNTPKTLTATEAVAMGKYLKARGDQIMAYSWQLKAQVNAAETIEALNAINIQEGWPV